MLLRLFGGEYQGNGEWAAFGILALAFSAYPWLRYWQSREELERPKLGDVITLSVAFLLFAAMALGQILTHP